ncbi:hypothetical protein AUQ39_04760 [Lacticaseibacillus casei]|uniref:Sulfatase N-terminal domain-containing protein n=2 Tax=Lacticaseibacillus TaxID=2759736 RepID=A0A5R8LSY1_LACZE|nr:LTA synthase family protein [Lacticaseibacillus zeae]OLS09989.1 hypothetical protein AUQ39_04760 [Lacticaseibacillus casei]QVI31120.1 sulfatase-like hydrolase/transferase [Lacticaseibacillus zeae]TLF40240.1 hypothetical protein FEI14_10530 [Lacticaseibacillus zeae]
MIDLDTRFNRLNVKTAMLTFYLRYKPWRFWIVFPMLITRLLFWLHRLDELDYQVKYWRYFINEPLPEKKWRQFGRRLSNRSRRRVKATTFIVADVPVFMLNWLVPDSRIVGLDIDEKGLRLPKARTLSAKIAFLQPESLVVSPRFFKTFVHHTSFENKTRIYANQHFFTSFKGFNRYQTVLFLRNVVALFAMAAFTAVVTIYMASAAYNLDLTNVVFKSLRLILLNILPIFVFMLIGYLLFNRVTIAILVGQVLAIVVALVNYFMLQYRDYPFEYSDISLASEASNMGSRYSYIPPVKYFLVIAVLLTLAVIVGRFLKTTTLRWWVRLLTLGLVFISSVFMMNHYYLVDDYYTLANNDPWGPDADRYVVNGYMFSFIHSVKNDWVIVPEGYNAATAKKALSAYQYQDIPADKRLNVITIQLEAFQDFSKWSDLEIDPSVYAGLHQVASEGMAGQLTTTIFGGGTVDTERKVLTGFSELSPINGMTNSFVQYFNEQKYITRFMHPGDAWFYNRQNIDRYLGFQKTLFRDNYYDQHVADVDVVPDTKVFNDLVKQLKKVNASGKQFFNQTVTMQNHGPYSTEFDGDSLLPWKKGYNKDDYAIINNYLTGVKETSDALLKLTNKLDRLNQPVVLAFWGDHNPWGGDQNSTYKMLGINLKQSTQEGYENYYNTPYVMWANEAAKKIMAKDFSGTGPTISPMYVLPEIFTHAGWKGSQYMQVLQNLEGQVPVFGQKNHYMINGKLTTKPGKSQKKAIKKFDDIQYYMKSNYMMNQKQLK